MIKKITRRKFCKHSSLLLLSSLFINFAKANPNTNQLIIGELKVNDKKVTNKTFINLNEKSEIVTGDNLVLLQNDQNGFLIRPNSKIKFYKNKIKELIKGSFHGIFGKQPNELQIKTPKGTIGIRGTVTYVEYENDFDRTYVCNCYGETAVYNTNMKKLKILSSKYHTPLVIDKNELIKVSPYDRPLNHFDDNIKSIENFLGRKPKWKLPNEKMIFISSKKEKIDI